MKRFVCAALLMLSFSALADEPTPIGEGKYMLGGRARTFFGTTAKIVANLMEDANEFCQDKFGKEAVLISSRGEEARMGVGASPTGSIEFRCGQSEESKSTSDNLDTLIKLKTLLDSGGITQEEYDAQKKKLLGE